MATFAIGDIHGNEATLADLLGQLEPLIRPEDTVVFVGDYIDRGPCSKQCIERILAFEQTCPATVVALLGNHEYSLLETLHDFTTHSWLIAMDAWPTIASYSKSAAQILRQEAEKAGGRLFTEEYRLPYELFFDAVPAAHLTFFRALKAYCRTPDGLCVHAGIDPRDGAIERQSEKMLVWGTYRFHEQYHGSETIVYGHYSNAIVDENAWPKPVVRDNSIGIDTIKYGVLTAIQLPDRRVFQSARYGEPQEDGWIY